MKNKLIATVVLIAVFVVCISCGRIEDKPIGGDIWGVGLYAKEISSTGMTLQIKQRGVELADDLMTGEAYIIEKQKNGIWVECPYVEENVGFNSVAHYIQADGSSSEEIDWEWLYGKLEEGTYRLSKKITLGDVDKTYYVEFEID